jgi:hypothetical protein
MNMLKKGPELKLSEIKVPDFLYDLYYDLRERHLLPLVALLLIAIVAAPFVLGGASDSSPAGASDSAVATPAVASSPGTLVVAKSAPGLRDYRRRLAHLRAKDPFKQQYAGPEAAGTEVAGGGAAGSQSSAGASGGESGVSLDATSAPSTTTTNVTTGPPSGAAATTETKAQTKYAADTIDVRIVPVDPGGDGTESSQARPSVRGDLPELTMLPDRATPVVVFMGASSDGKKALLLVSSDVRSIFGDGQCVIGTQVCQLLALEAGLPETFVYGPQGRTYRIEILKIDKTLGDKPHRASLGKPKKKGQAGPISGPESPPASG